MKMGDKEDSWGSSSDSEEDKNKFVAEKWKSKWGSANTTPVKKQSIFSDGANIKDNDEEIIGATETDIESAQPTVQKSQSSNMNTINKEPETEPSVQIVSNQSIQQNSTRDLINFAESLLIDAQVMLQGKSKIETSQEVSPFPEHKMVLPNRREVETSREYEDEKSRWSDSDVRENVNPISNPNTTQEMHTSSNNTLLLKKEEITIVQNQNTETIDKVQNSKENVSIQEKLDQIEDWSSTSSNISPIKSRPDATKENLSLSKPTFDETELKNEIVDLEQPSPPSSWSSHSNDKIMINSSPKENSIKINLELENGGDKTDVLFIPKKVSTWTDSSSKDQKLEDNQISNQSTNKGPKDSNNVNIVSWSSSDEDEQENKDIVNQSKALVHAHVDREETSSLEPKENQNDVRLARVTSSEIFGDLELEFEIDPLTKKVNNSSEHGDSSSVYYDHFIAGAHKKKSDEIKTLYLSEQSNPLSTTNDASLSSHQDNLKKVHKKTDPIPYSTLLLGNPNEAFSKTTKSKTLKPIKSKGSKSANDLINAMKKSSSDLSLDGSSTSTRKPFFSRLKKKFTKTMSRSSSLHSSKSLPMLAEEGEDKSSEIQTNTNNNVPVIEPVPEIILSEHRCFQMLIEAKTLLETCLSPEDKLEIAQKISAKKVDSEYSENDDNLSSLPSGIQSHENLLEWEIDKEETSRDSLQSTSNQIIPRSNGSMRLCDSFDPCHPDPNSISTLLNEIGCIYSKIIGSNCGFVKDFGNLEVKLRDLSDRLSCCERCKAELEREILRIQNEIRCLQKALEEETQRRMNLEGLVQTLRNQLQCIEEKLYLVSGEKAQLEMLVQELQSKLQGCFESIQTLENERTQFNYISSGQDNQIQALKDALDKCCTRAEELAAENSRLQAEICRLKRELDELRAERDALLAKLECERQAWNKERCILEELIATLKCQNSCLEREKEEAYEKFSGIIALHHEELDCLKQGKENAERLYQEERKAREDLENRLRDCEEQKRRGVEQTNYQTSQAQMQNMNRSEKLCDQYNFDVERLEQERSELQNARKCIELEQKLVEAHLERTVLINQVEEYRRQNTFTTTPLVVQPLSLSHQMVQTEKEEVIVLPTLPTFSGIVEEEKVALVEQLRDVENNNSTLEAEIYQLRNQLDSEIQEKLVVEDQKIELQQQYLSVKSDKLKLEQIIESKHNIEDERQQLRNELKSTQTEKISLENEKQQLCEELNLSLKAKARLEEEKEQLKVQLQSLEDDKVGLEEFLNSYEKDFKEERQDLTEKLNSSTKNETAFENEKRHLMEQLIAIKHDKLMLEEKLQASNKAEDWKSGNSIALQTESDNKIDEIRKEHESKIDQIKAELLMESNSEIQKKTEEIRQCLKKEADMQLKKDASETRNRLEHKAESKVKELSEELKRKLEHEYEERLSMERKKIAADVNANSSVIDDLSAVNKTLKHESKRFKKMVNERDEHIGALQAVVNQVKKKYSEQSKQLRVQKIQMEALRSDIEKLETQNQLDQTELEKENRKLLQERSALEDEKRQFNVQANDFEKERTTLQNLKKMKDRIESDVARVQEAITTRLVDRCELESLKAFYEEKISGIKNQFEAQLEMNRQLAEINEYLGRQAQDRALIEKIRDSNENLLRKELNSVSVAMKLDTEKLKTLIKERDEEIASLRKAVGVLKVKYANEAQQREDLVKKVQILSTVTSRESLHPSNSNNNNSITLTRSQHSLYLGLHDIPK